MDFSRYKRNTAPLAELSCPGSYMEFVALYSGWSASAFPSPRRGSRHVGSHSERHPPEAFRGEFVSGYGGLLSRRAVRAAPGHAAWLVEARSGHVQRNDSVLRPISPLAWIPLAMLWFGIGDKPAIFLIFLSSFFPLLLSTIHAVNHINSLYFQVAANFNFGKLEVVRKIIFPAILPAVLPALRISLGIAWLVVVAAEMIAVKSGLGYLILDSRNALRMDYVMDAMIAIGLIGICLDRVIVQLNRIKFVSWGSR